MKHLKRYLYVIAILASGVFLSSCRLNEGAPGVKNITFSNILATKVTVTYDVDQNGATVTETKVYFSEFRPNPSHSSDGVGEVIATLSSANEYSATITGLNPGTTYYIGASAKNKEGRVHKYSSVQTLEIAVANPQATNLTGTTATLGGEVLASPDSAAVDGRGVVYSLTATNDDPAIGGTGVTNLFAGGTGSGAFTVNATGLTPGTQYTFRAYATVAGGDVVYSAKARFPFDFPFETPGFGLGYAQAVATQPDGKLLVGGRFDEVDGEVRSNLARFHADGTLDTGFGLLLDPTEGEVRAIVVQPDGKILVGGEFPNLNGVALSSPNMIRLNPDGSLDESFLAAVKGSGRVDCIALQKDGKVVIAGDLQTVNGDIRYRTLARLHSDGSLDTSYNSAGQANLAGPNLPPQAIAILDDGKILLGGQFGVFNSVTVSGFVRVNTNGSLDTSFSPGFTAECMAVQGDGKIVVSEFQGGEIGIRRLNTDGSLDTSFAPGSSNVVATDIGPNSMVVTADGKILIAGTFSNVAGSARQFLARLMPDGTLDTAFDPMLDPAFTPASVQVALTSDGNAWITGSVDDSGTRPYFRAVPLEGGTKTLSYPAVGTVEWLLGGTTPALARVQFETSSDGGATWTPVGDGTRIAGGWQLTGFTPPTSGILRAHGKIAGAIYNNSSGLVDQTETLPTPGLSLPTVESPSLTALTNLSATLAATVTSDGGFPILERGVVYSRYFDNEDPFVGGAKISQVVATGTTGPFSADATVVRNTLYVFRAYARTSVGIGYSDPVRFDAGGAPLVEGPTVTDVMDTSATIGGTVSSDRGSPIIERGVAYYRVDVPNLRLPDASAFQKVPDSGNGTGTFTIPLTGLTPDREYVFAAYAVNAFGTSFSNVRNFQTPVPAPPPSAPEEEAGETELTESPAPPPGGIVSRSTTGGSTGGLDTSHNAAIDSLRFINALAIQPDRKVIFSGDFILQGSDATDVIARLNFNGAIDTGFNTDLDGTIYSIILQPDGKILLGGLFETVNDTLTQNIARLEADGSTEDLTTFSPGTGTDHIVYCLALQPDGKILLGGLFETVNGFDRVRLARLEEDGSVDTTFDPGTGADDAVLCLALQDDGKIVIAGYFQNIDGTPRTRIARLNSDGALDTSFDPGTGAGARITALTVQPDGKILIGGAFQNYDGTEVGRIARLNADGSLDTSFNPGTGADDEILTLALQADGKILIGGLFQNVNGSACTRIARLAANGSLDTTFETGTGADDEVSSIALQQDGKVVIGGLFQNVDGAAHNGLARFTNDEAEHLLRVLNGTAMRWTLGGATPEVQPPLFEVSTDSGETWENLGSGSKAGDDWALTGQALPLSGRVRATGQTRGGYLNGSSGVVQDTFLFDHAAVVASLRAQQSSTLSKIKKTKKQIKKVRKKKKVKKVKKLKKKFQKLKKAARTFSARLALYP